MVSEVIINDSSIQSNFTEDNDLKDLIKSENNFEMSSTVRNYRTNELNEEKNTDPIIYIISIILQMEFRGIQTSTSIKVIHL